MPKLTKSLSHSSRKYQSHFAISMYGLFGMWVWFTV